MTEWVCITWVRICGQLPGDLILEWWKGRGGRVSLPRERHPLPSLVTRSSSCLKKGRMRETRVKACILNCCFLLAHLTFGPNKRCDNLDGSSPEWGSCEGTSWLPDVTWRQEKSKWTAWKTLSQNCWLCIFRLIWNPLLSAYMRPKQKAVRVRPLSP